ncbi:Pycsar system effector family protein [Streptomyces sp. NPDC006733]|uniref:Pycsar system effector family protein n=1 Tax=Streptomyces sp. NPDC006733 TaxID=3155460 RepID=UPI00340428DC
MAAAAPDPHQDAAQERIAATVASLQADLGRSDTKASLLLGLAGAALVALASAAPGRHPTPPVAVAASLGATALLTAAVLLLCAVRPHLGGTGWTSWSPLSAEQLRARLTAGYQVEHLRFMAALATRKFRLIRLAVDCMLAGVGLLAVAAVLVATT